MTPIHYIMGELGSVNGETLTATELPLATRSRSRHKHLTAPTRGVFRRFALVRGSAVAERAGRRRAVAQPGDHERRARCPTLRAGDSTISWPFPAIAWRRYGLSQPGDRPRDGAA